MSNKIEQIKNCNTCKNIQPGKIAKKEEKSKVIKACFNCSIPLTNENQVKGRNQYKNCRSKQYSVFDGTKTCSNCEKVLTLENCTKNRPNKIDNVELPSHYMKV
jgi:hypothetical protein